VELVAVLADLLHEVIVRVGTEVNILVSLVNAIESTHQVASAGKWMGPGAYPNPEGCNPARELTSYLRIEERELQAGGRTVIHSPVRGSRMSS
jgi:hypothetical protein